MRISNDSRAKSHDYFNISDVFHVESNLFDFFLLQNCSGDGLSDLNEALQLSGSAKTRLFHVRGTCKDNTRLIEVDCDASSLNSDDVFLAINKNSAFVWIGKVKFTAEKVY